MKKIDEQELDLPPKYAELFEDVRLVARRFERQMGGDEIQIHVYQPSGDEEHRVSKFIVDSETDQTTHYHPTRGNAEPWDAALVGLHLYGYSCPKFEREKTPEEIAEHLPQDIQRAMVLINDTARNREMDPILEQAIEHSIAALAITAACLDFERNEDESLYSFLARVAEGDEAASALDEKLEMRVVDDTASQYTESLLEQFIDTAFEGYDE